MKSILRIISVFLLLCAAGRLSAKDAWVVVTGESYTNGALVYWVFDRYKDLPKGFEAMIVKRRIANDKAAAWQKLHKSPIQASSLLAVNWDNVIPDKAGRAHFEAKYQEVVENAKKELQPDGGKKKGIFFKGALDESFGKNVVDAKWELVEILEVDFECSLFVGAGFFDSVAKRNQESFLYGVFPVIAGKVADMPIGTWRPIADRNSKNLSLIEPKVPHGTGYNLAWKVHKDTVTHYQISHYHVFRKAKGASVFEKARDVEMEYEFTIEDGHFIIEYTDQDADYAKSYSYRIVPVQVLDRSYERETIVEYKPTDEDIEYGRFKDSFSKRTRPKVEPVLTLQAAELRQIGANSKGNCFVSWYYPQTEQKTIKGFDIYRRPAGGQWTKVTKNVIKPTVRDHTDFETLLHGRRYEMKVVAVSKTPNIKSVESAPMAFEYRRPTPIPMVRNLKAERVSKDGYGKMRLSWDPPTDASGVKKYIVASDRYDKGKLMMEGSYTNLTGTEVYLGLGLDSRDYIYGVAVQNTFNEMGEFSTVTKKSVRGNKVPKPFELAFSDSSPNMVYATLSWKVPEDFSPYVKGFRLYYSLLEYNPKTHKWSRRKENLIADETVLKGDARTFRIGPCVAKSQHWYSLRTVSIEGRVSSQTMGHAYKPYYEDRVKLPMEIKSSVSGLTLDYREDPSGPDLLTASWEFPEEETDLIGHYEVNVHPVGAVTVALPLKAKRKLVRLPVAEAFSGDLKVEVIVVSFQGVRFKNQVKGLNIPSRKIVKSQTQQYAPVNQIIVICSIASVLLFITLLIGIGRRIRNGKGN